VLIEDLNLDGWDDLTFVSHYNGSNHTTEQHHLLRQRHGLLVEPHDDPLHAQAPGRAWSRISTVDGYPDLIFCNYYSGTSYSTNSYIYWGSSGGYSSADRTSLPTLGCYDVDTADFNADGLHRHRLRQPLRRQRLTPRRATSTTAPPRATLPPTVRA
jgi:hypothetical protein